MTGSVRREARVSSRDHEGQSTWQSFLRCDNRVARVEAGCRGESFSAPRGLGGERREGREGGRGRRREPSTLARLKGMVDIAGEVTASNPRAGALARGRGLGRGGAGAWRCGVFVAQRFSRKPFGLLTKIVGTLECHDGEAPSISAEKPKRVAWWRRVVIMTPVAGDHDRCEVSAYY